MNTATASAFSALLATMTEAQRAALLDCLGMHIENVETDDSFESEEDKDASLETEGHLFLVGVRDATIKAISAS